MWLIGLTGSIACGKSTVASMLEAMGCALHDADKAVHDLYQNEAVPWFKTNMPEAVENEIVSRERLSAILRAKPELLKPLENAIHPMVFAQRVKKMQDAQKQGKEFFILDVPLLFETNGYKQTHVNVTVFCSDESQEKRALARPNMTLEKLNFIRTKQMPQIEKCKRAHFSINTETTLDETRAQTASFIKALRGRK